MNNAQTDLKLDDYVTMYWGEKCPDYEPLCPACVAWSLFEKNNKSVPTDDDVVRALSEVRGD
jgi:hypothetical protein